MVAVPTISQKLKEDTFVSWVDPAILAPTSTFTCKCSLKRAFLNIGPSFEWGVLIPQEDKRICNEYDECAIPFYECVFRS